MKLSKRFSKGLPGLSVLLLIGFLMTGCLPEYYNGQMYSLPSPVLNSPSNGEITYLGGSIDFGDGTNSDENSFQGKLYVEHGYTGDFFSVAGRGEMYQGFYNVEAIEEMEGESLKYYGFSPQLNASLFFPVKNIRFGIYALAGPYWEYGEYIDWLEEADEEGLISYMGNDGDTQFVYSGGLLLEHVVSVDKIVSFKFGANSPVVGHIITQYRTGKNVFKFGIGRSLSASYGIVW